MMIIANFLKAWWVSKEKKKAYFSVFSLLFIGIVDVCANFGFSQWQKSFYDALEQKEITQFFYQILLFIPVAILVLISFVGSKFLKEWTSFRWRRWMTEHFQNKWLMSRSYYKMSLYPETIDNPDQRIAQDVKEVSEKTVKLFAIFFKDGLNFVTFSIVLWTLSETLGFFIPGFLLWSAILYAFFAIIITFKIGKPLIALDQIQEKVEANFRYKLVRILEKKEEIAKLSGEKYEDSILTLSFQEIGKNYMKILTQKMYLNTAEIFHGQGNMFVPLILAAPFYFKGIITLGTLMQIRFIFYEVYRSLSSCAYEYQHIASLRASLNRLLDFSKTIEMFDSPSSHVTQTNLKIQNLEILTPEGEPIWTISSLSLKKQERKVLQAPSGTGKTSFLRAVSGIYPFYKGEIHLPDSLMIIPQRPYMPLGTLRSVLSYPSLKPAKSPETLMEICGLSHLISLLDMQDDYQQILSGGEQQRINFVRILLQRPEFLIMDEPVSALDEEAADKLIEILTTHLPETGILFLSHTMVQGFKTIRGVYQR